ncbi:DinB family protein [Virgibacillus dakarensis]|nr:DinB family protein [Virgibacillus dakarensis]MBT2217359.1 DinB family protein [Virgibacillus dakarensis]
MEIKYVFIQQLTACHDQNTWFVSLRNAIDGISEEQASWKDNESTNSIWEIVNHLAFYNQRYLNRFNGIPNAKGVNSNDSTFYNNGEISWQSTIKLIDKIMTDWRSSINNCNDEKMNDWSSEIAHLTLHNAYHIGQIVHIRKQMGAWDREQGVH